jgi:hypothetical protein
LQGQKDAQRPTTNHAIEFWWCYHCYYFNMPQAGWGLEMTGLGR